MATRQTAKFPPTGAGLVAFIDHAMERGLVQPQLGASYKTTCIEVLPMTLGQGWESTDILAVDISWLLDKFQQIKGRRMPAAGLEQYNQRLIEAIELFRQHTDRPADSAPSRDRVISAPIVTPDPVPELPVTDLDPVAPGPIVPPDHDEAQTDPMKNGHGELDALPMPLVPAIDPSIFNGTGTLPGSSSAQTSPVPEHQNQLTYPFPLRDGLVVTLTLPVDLAKAEAKRLARFLDCLAISSTPVPAISANSQASGTPRRGKAATRSRPRPEQRRTPATVSASRSPSKLAK